MEKPRNETSIEEPIEEADEGLDAALDEALQLTFPASDPVSIEQRAVARSPRRRLPPVLPQTRSASEPGDK